MKERKYSMKVEKADNWLAFNMNDECKVVLTNVGAEWLNKANKEKKVDFRTCYPTMWTENEMERMFPTNNEEGDVVKGSLWEIMEKFGQYFYGNTEAPFKNNSISIAQDK